MCSPIPRSCIRGRRCWPSFRTARRPSPGGPRYRASGPHRGQRSPLDYEHDQRDEADGRHNDATERRVRRTRLRFAAKLLYGPSRAHSHRQRRRPSRWDRKATRRAEPTSWRQADHLAGPRRSDSVPPRGGGRYAGLLHRPIHARDLARDRTDRPPGHRVPVESSTRSRANRAREPVPLLPDRQVAIRRRARGEGPAYSPRNLESGRAIPSRFDSRRNSSSRCPRTEEFTSTRWSSRALMRGLGAATTAAPRPRLPMMTGLTSLGGCTRSRPSTHPRNLRSRSRWELKGPRTSPQLDRTPEFRRSCSSSVGI